MKIIYLHQYFKFPNESGGTRSYDLSMGFIRSGHEVEILTSTSDEKFRVGKRWIKKEHKGLTVHYIYLPYGNQLSNIKRSIIFFQFLWFTTFKLLSMKGDVILATSTPLTIGIPALIKKWFHQTKFIFEVRDVWPEAVIAIGAIKNKILQKILFALEYKIYKNASAIVALSEDMKLSIHSRYPKLQSKTLAVIENISEISRFQKKDQKQFSVLEQKIGYKPRFTVLYAGTFGKVNGMNYVISFAEGLFQIDPSIVFVLIGEGAEKAHVIQEAQNRGVLNNNVFILDSISKQELPQLYFECSMGSSFVIPIKELWANSANKFFDTLAAGKPILINYEGWQKNIIVKRNIGFVLPESNSIDSTIAFADYTKNSDLQKKQCINALKTAKEKYSLELALKKYELILKKVF